VRLPGERGILEPVSRASYPGALDVHAPVRTTLKRAAGRAETNGRVPTPPAPGAASGGPPPGPVNRYSAGRRSRWRLAGKIVLWLLVACLVAAGALGGGVWLYLNESVAAVQAHSPEVRQVEQEGILDAPLPGRQTTAIIICYDKRAGAEGAADVGRSDTIMLLRADPTHDTLSLLSFPRDLVVDHPGCAAREPWRDRINTAYAFCGPAGVVKTVKQLTNLPINYVIVVNFSGFKGIVNKLGGVWVDVDRRYFNDNSQGGESYATIDLQPGYQRLLGGPALDYARFRHTDSDFHRNARQQAFVKAFKQRVSSSFSVFKLPGIINTITENVEVGRGGKKELDLETVLGYARFIYDLPSGHFFQVRLEGLTGYAELTAEEGSVQDAVAAFLNPDVDAPKNAAAAATGVKPNRKTPLPSETTIEVQNGNGVDGAADTAAYLLTEREYVVENAGNADRFDYFYTQVVYDSAKAGAAAAAKAVGDLFGDAEVVAASPGDEPETMLRVIVGETFKGTIADAPIDETPEHEPPVVTTSYDDVLPPLREARRRVDFPLLVPTVKESASALDSDVPFRVYRLEGHDAVRIVYRTSNAGDYWGVQQTSWTDAPILQGENTTRRIGGRTYRLYFSGSKLHMVAFEDAGAVYWVSNTLLDRLSNETMLAIAKGLKPFGSLP
jgi:LCP family protein required for cell wall assembly